MKIETERMELVILKPRELMLLAKNIGELEKELDFTYSGEPLMGGFLRLIESQAEKAAADEQNYIFHSFCLIIRKSDRAAVGSMAFKTLPFETGETEIGYGLGEANRGKGYMTEAVKAMSAWALSQSYIDRVTAGTDSDNLPSQNVLKRCGFEKFKEEITVIDGKEEIGFWWKLEK